jgi:hypothetical protein
MITRRGEEVATVRGMRGSEPKQRQKMRMTELGKHELLIRRAANKNAHIITPHGKIQAGRKGRRG